MTKLKNKIRKKIDETDLHDSLVKVKEALAEATGDVKGRASEMVSELLEKLQSTKSDYQTEIEEAISEKPLKTLGIAIVFGILVGKFVI